MAAPLLPIVAIGAALYLAKGRPGSVSAPQSTPVRGTAGFGAMSQQDMQMVQYDLAWLGYYWGPIHGKMTDAVKKSVRSFQDDHGIHPADGLPGPDTLRILDAVVAAQP